jgi:hypothetical protein
MAESDPKGEVARSSDDFEVPQFSRARTLDHEVRKLPESTLERRRKKKLLTISEELQARQAKASERNAVWARWAALLALVGLVIAVIQQVH